MKEATYTSRKHRVYLVQGARSYIGIAGGMYHNLSAEELGARTLAAYLERLEARSGFCRNDIELIIAGNAVGGGGNITRLMALCSGLPASIPAYTLDLQCGSGLACIIDAANRIQSGEADVILAGGFESSSTAPLRSYSPAHPDYEEFVRFHGSATYHTAHFAPGPHTETTMLSGAEQTARQNGITRNDLTHWVLSSHARAKFAAKNHILDSCIIPFPDYPAADEGVTRHISEKLCSYVPCSLPDGQVITAANACRLNDAAAFLLLVSEEYAKTHNLPLAAEYIGSDITGGDPQQSPLTAISSIEKLLTKYQLSAEDISVFECNEAFAVIDELFFRRFGQTAMEHYNIYGGALAYGHPFAASGGIITIHGLQALLLTQGKYGVFSAAGAGGIGTSLLVRRTPQNYYDVLLEQNGEKEALVVDGNSYRYDDLQQETRRMHTKLLSCQPSSSQSRQLYYIQSADIHEQLVSFLACQGTRFVPLLLPVDLPLETVQDISVQIPEAAVMAVCTSGTTGTPKILFRSFRSWYDFFAVQDSIFGIDESTRMFAQGSLAFTGNLNLYMDVLCAGGCIIAENGFYPVHWETIFTERNVNLIYLIPSKLLLLPRLMHSENHNIKHILSGSQSLGQADALRLKQYFPQSEILLYYGASELNYITYVKDSQMSEKRNLIGRPFPGVHVFLKEEKIYVDTPWHIEGIRMPYSLSDSGYQDRDGNFYYTGRSDDILCFRGRKLSALKIENAISEIDGILECCVTVRDYANDQILTVYAVTDPAKLPKQNLSLAAMLPFLAHSLAPYEIPKRWIAVSSLPKTESGKVQRKLAGAYLE